MKTIALALGALALSITLAAPTAQAEPTEGALVYIETAEFQQYLLSLEKKTKGQLLGETAKNKAWQAATCATAGGVTMLYAFVDSLLPFISYELQSIVTSRILPDLDKVHMAEAISNGASPLLGLFWDVAAIPIDYLPNFTYRDDESDPYEKNQRLFDSVRSGYQGTKSVYNYFLKSGWSDCSQYEAKLLATKLALFLATRD